MKRYRITQWAIVLSLILYPLIAFTTIGLPQRELFPFFSWELFSHIPPPEITSYGIRFSSANGQTLTPPIYFEEAKHLTPYADSVDAFVTIQSLGQAVEQSDQSKMMATQQLIQSAYFGELTSANYQLVRRRFDLLERWQLNQYAQENVLTDFSYP